MSLKAIYDEQGYVVVPGLVSPNDMQVLKDACDRIVTRTRTGQWPYRRTVGKQFPPYGEGDTDSWSVQHIMHPGLGEKVFVEWYTSDELVGVVRELMGDDVEEHELQMELFNLLINPLHRDFALRWHRDDIREDATEEDERQALKKWQYGIQWNTALYVDSCLYIVPGSHEVPRTAGQRLSSSGQTLEDPLEMPGSIQLTLQPGETVFYNSNVLHCAAYKSSEQRQTLHACMGNAAGGSIRAKNILQHGLNWMKEKEFADTMPSERAVKMLKKLIEMHDGSVGMRVTYSLEG